ncbi:MULTISPECIES: type II toxin-antitoxin system Phd/YefM family antitoxin [unclassified Leclercia]|uniref:Antitoxin n=1 Tax=Leclercia barmai TaxID=2785629 RepID=A0ABS7RZ59_9ENTR|nr:MULTISPECIES: type II toxin-antitoxin system Phd/YefM family antitoxin [unclassified Leclercia]MBZ0059596.1 hypothetical protein [Leclercia sp. EMC7]MCM5697272.1 type II toxin-antitoxin system Phd/YefM family antitoxin [Leclercia sp. LTM01]MCM5702133.1 type II toxin-antitoxin system Phd/YefM family antitoxin [Leclercia sp. LTM14]
MQTVNHATAARMIAALLASVDKTGAPVQIVDPGRHRAVLISIDTWRQLCEALSIPDETIEHEQDF